MTKKFLILIISSIFFISLPASRGIEAKGISLFVSPPIFELELEPGGSYEDEIYLLNQSELALPIEARVVNFLSPGEMGNMEFDLGEEDISINPRKWFKINTPNFILEPNKPEKVKFEINLPENAEPGGHYATILFEPKLPSFYFEKNVLKTIPQVGVPYLISVKTEGLVESEAPLTIVEFNIPENLHFKGLENFLLSYAGFFTEAIAAEGESFSIVETGHLSFSLRIKNNDIYHVKPKGELLVLTGGNKIIGKTEITETTILPGKVRDIPIDFKPESSEKLEKYLPASLSNFITRNFLFGNYKASLQLVTEKSTIKKDIEFLVLPWKFALSTVFIVVLMLFVMIKYRNRIMLSLKVLFRK